MELLRDENEIKNDKSHYIGLKLLVMEIICFIYCE